jgi:hypothetical protein
MWSVIMAATLSNFASILWLYDAKSVGKFGIILVGFFDFYACARLAQWLGPFDIACSGLLLGFAVTAMLLGHWYLNTPSMNISPLRLLILLFLAAIVVRIAGELASGRTSWEFLAQVPVAWLALRWLAGVMGPIVAGMMVWQTLKIPNTQSATGLLYVVVVLVFLGESVSVFWTT